MTQRSTYLMASAVLALAMATPVMVAAQSGQNNGQEHDRRQPAQGAGQTGGEPAQRRQAPAQQPRPSNRTGTQARGAAPVALRAVQPAPVRAQSRQNGGAAPSGHTVQPRTDRPVPIRPQRNLAPQQRTQAVQVPSRAPTRPANVQALRRNVQVQHHYHAGTYQAPRGYAQHRWSYGQRLPVSYYARNYWISNYLLYALFAPPSGLVWVRVGNDAFLIDRYDGEIIQARYNVFY